MRRSLWLGAVELAATVCFAALLSSCNDAPSIVGSELVPGTDMIYTASTDSLPLIGGDSTAHTELPLLNSAYFLLGSTPTADARAFFEVLNYPASIAGDSSYSDSTFEVTSANLQIYPQHYGVGDTLDKTLALNVYELKKFWPANVTWDSIWSGTGSTEYYSTADRPIATYSGTMPSIVPDSTVINIPFDQATVKRWIVASRDTAARKLVYGFALVPSGMKHIRQFRNITSGVQSMRLRVITRKRNDTIPFIYNLDMTVAGFVNDLDPTPTSLTIQGSRNVKASFTVSLDSLPAGAIIMGADLRLTVDAKSSLIGSLGQDDKIGLDYQPPTGQRISIDSKSDSSGVYRFANIGPLIDIVRRHRQPARFTIRTTGSSEFWTMNRTVFHGSTAATALRPRLTLIYTVPTGSK
ncbi:MAG: hypothetical protein FGM32_11560 [Candidatus Kapabacteria bacterium]|nr:hypothetical protein [Candidatus Kapabacteria bacterium]